MQGQTQTQASLRKRKTKVWRPQYYLEGRIIMRGRGREASGRERRGGGKGGRIRCGQR